MRSRTSIRISSTPYISMSSNSWFYTSNPTARTQRTTPVWLHYHEPSFQDGFEAASELPGTNTRDRWNNFEHYKLKTYANQLKADVKYYSSQYLATMSAVDEFRIRSSLWGNFGSAWGAPGCPTEGQQALYVPQPDNHFIVEPDGTSEYVARSLSVMLPHIKSEMSLVNSIIELKDFKSLGVQLSRIMKGQFKKDWSSLRSLVNYAGRKMSLRQLLRGTANVYLQTQFNILPLLSDIAAMQRCLKGTANQVAKLQGEAGKRLKRRYTCPLESACWSTEETKSWGFPTVYQPNYIKTGQSHVTGEGSGTRHAGTFKGTRTMTSSGSFNAQIEYSYTFLQYQKEHAKMLGLLDGLGVNLNPAIIWNAIPWSFVVDWVVGVSRWLGQFKVSNMDPSILIYRYAYSTNQQRDTTVRIQPNVGLAYASSPAYTSTQTTETAYRRVVGKLNWISAITATGLNPKEFTLAGALVASRRGRR